MYNQPNYRYKVYNHDEVELQTVLDTEPMESHWFLIKVIKIDNKQSVAVFQVN